MKGLFGALEKAGLIQARTVGLEQAVVTEPSESGGEISTQGVDSQTVAAADGVARAAGSAVDVASELDAEKIFAERGVPESRFPAEKLMRLLDGLSAMDADTQLLAVRAMDSADDSWTITDAIDDARGKVAALLDHGTQLRQSVQDLERGADAELSAARVQEADTVQGIRQQITDLEAMLQRELARSAQQQADISSSLERSKAAAQFQLAQASALIEKYQRIVTMFGSTGVAGQARGSGAA